MSGDLDRDRAAVAGMPPGTGHDVRKNFLGLHARRLYDAATDGLRVHLGLRQLADFAAAMVPGLVPTSGELAAESMVSQSAKVGREVELGILYWSVLSLPEAGDHLLHSLRLPTRRAVEALPGFRAAGFADLGAATVQRVDGIAYVTVRNPLYLNAEDDLVVEALETAVDLALLDDGVSVGVLRGGEMTHPRYAGRRVFNAGINLTHLYEGRISLQGFLLRRELGYINKIYRGLATGQSKPWVAAVDSFAIGGGAQLTLVFDHVLLERGAYFTVPALQEGIIPGAANLRLHRLAGTRLARQMIFANRRIGTEDPEVGLLCDEIAEPGQMDKATTVAAERLANPAVVANRRMLHLAEEPEELFRRYMAQYALEQAHLLYSNELIANLERTWIGRAR
jgi:(3,5-dihydroxyphenyl)acetyl-CoA 1,2-dioxygenase